MKVFKLPPLPSSRALGGGRDVGFDFVYSHSYSPKIYGWDGRDMTQYGEDCMVLGYDEGVANAVKLLREFGQSSTSLKTVFEALASELEKRLE